MMEPRLQHQIGGLEKLLRRSRLLRKLALVWAAAAVFALALFLGAEAAGWNFRHGWIVPLAAGFVAAIVVRVRERRRPADYHAVISVLERDEPGLRPLLAAAIEQQPDPDSGEFRFLQWRVIDEALGHRHFVVWEQELRRKVSSARKARAFAFMAFVGVLFLYRLPAEWQPSPQKWFEREIVVTPGDTEIERGAGLMISARFGGKPPPEASLVLVSASGKTRRIALERHLSDPVFAGSVLEVAEDVLYRIEYGRRRTRDYKIAVFDYPALTRADAALRYPEYTGLTNRVIPDTRRVSAVEGTRLTYTLELNKPVVRARFVGKEQTLALTVSSNSAVATLDELTLTNSARYALELVDADGRTNRTPADFSIQVVVNRPPELKLAFPRGDPRVSPLEELQLQANAADDFGVLKYGIGFGIAGEDPQFVELGQSARANEKRPFDYLIALEQLQVEVDQVVAYFAWAEDHGPDGRVRRTFSDMFFAEVRPFEEIYRADQSGGAEAGQQQQQGGQQGGQNAELAELQKDIVIATWKLQQGKQGAGDAGGK